MGDVSKRDPLQYLSFAILLERRGHGRNWVPLVVVLLRFPLGTNWRGVFLVALIGHGNGEIHCWIVESQKHDEREREREIEHPCSCRWHSMCWEMGYLHIVDGKCLFFGNVFENGVEEGEWKRRRVWKKLRIFIFNRGGFFCFVFLELEFGIWWWRFLLIVEGEKEKAWKQKKMGGTGVRTRGRCWKIFKVGKRGGKEGVKGKIEKVAVNKTVKIFAGMVSVWNSSLGAKTVKLWGGEWKEPKNDWPKLGLSAHFFNLYGFFF